MVTGKPGSGKTVLFHWMVDRLQRRMLGKSYIPVSCLIGMFLVIPPFKFIARLSFL